MSLPLSDHSTTEIHKHSQSYDAQKYHRNIPECAKIYVDVTSERPCSPPVAILLYLYLLHIWKSSRRTKLSPFCIRGKQNVPAQKRRGLRHACTDRIEECHLHPKSSRFHCHKARHFQIHTISQPISDSWRLNIYAGGQSRDSLDTVHPTWNLE